MVATAGKIEKRRWLPEEDEKLKKFINSCGVHRVPWKNVPEKAGLSRSLNSCRTRWENELRPDLIKGPLTEEEKQQILALQRDPKFTDKWSEIAKRLPGRTDNQVKNFCNQMKKEKKKLKSQLQSSSSTDAIDDSNVEMAHQVPSVLGEGGLHPVGTTSNTNTGHLALLSKILMEDGFGNYGSNNDTMSTADQLSRLKEIELDFESSLSSGGGVHNIGNVNGINSTENNSINVEMARQVPNVPGQSSLHPVGTTSNTNTGQSFPSSKLLDLANTVKSNIEVNTKILSQIKVLISQLIAQTKGKEIDHSVSTTSTGLLGCSTRIPTPSQLPVGEELTMCENTDWGVPCCGSNISLDGQQAFLEKSFMEGDFDNYGSNNDTMFTADELSRLKEIEMDMVPNMSFGGGVHDIGNVNGINSTENNSNYAFLDEGELTMWDVINSFNLESTEHSLPSPP